MTNPQFYKSAIDASGCISNAWEMIKPNYWLYFAMSLLTYVLIACIPCLNVFLMGPIMGGLYFVSLKGMRGEPIEFGMLFKGFEKFVPLMVVGLVQSIPGIIYQFLNFGFNFTSSFIDGLNRARSPRGSNFSQFLAADADLLAGGIGVLFLVLILGVMIFMIVWSITFAFAVPIMMDNDVSIGDALKLSARAGWGNVGGIIVLAILGGLLMLVGALGLCVGAFFVLPVVWVSWAFAYRQVFPDLGPSNLRTEPPTPDFYQGSFGQGM